MLNNFWKGWYEDELKKVHRKGITEKFYEEKAFRKSNKKKDKEREFFRHGEYKWAGRFEWFISIWLKFDIFKDKNFANSKNLNLLKIKNC